MKLKSVSCACLLVSFIATSGCSENNSSTPLSDSSTPAVSESLALTVDSYLIAATSRDVYKISALTGNTERIYENGVAGATWQFLSPADVVNDVALLSATDNTLNAIDISSGSFLWELSLGDSFRGLNPSVPSCSSTLCYLVGGGNDLIAVDPSNASIVWSTSLDLNNGQLQATDFRHPLITDQLIYVGVDYGDGSYSLNVYSRTDGRLHSSVQFAKQIYGTPTIHDDKLLIVAEDVFYALDLETFSVLWQTEFTGLSIPALVGNTAVVSIRDDIDQYVSTKFGTVGISLDTGRVVWALEGTPWNSVYRPSSDDSIVIALEPADPTILSLTGTTFGIPNGIRASDGANVWTHTNIGRTEYVPLVVPGHLFFVTYVNAQTTQQGITSMNSRTGAINWFENTGFAEEVNRYSTETMLVHDGEVYRSEEFPTIAKTL